LKGSIPAARVLLELTTPAQRERGQIERSLVGQEMHEGDLRVAGKTRTQFLQEMLRVVQRDLASATEYERALIARHGEQVLEPNPATPPPSPPPHTGEPYTYLPSAPRLNGE
jgi:hypothetical protein